MNILKRSVLFSSVIMFALGVSNLALGQIFTADPGDWNDPLNWDTGSVPSGVNAVVGDDLVLSPATANITADVPDYGDLRAGVGGIGGINSVGTVNHSAGTANAGGWVFMGVDNFDTTSVAVGTYNLTGTGIWNTANTFLGTGGGLDGVRTAEGYLNIADDAQLNSGSLNVGNNDDNYGEVNQTGGSVNLTNNPSGAAWFNVGDNVSGHGLYNMSGGSLIADQISVGQGENSSGELNLSGSASLTQADPTQGLRVGRGVIPNQTPLVFAEGSLSITGGGVTVSATNFSVGADETGEFGGGPSITPAEGTLRFTSDATGISLISVSGDVLLNDGSGGAGTGFADLVVDLETDPVAGDVVLVDLTSTGTVTGTFMGLAEGASVPGSGGRTITYAYGPDGNDIALVSVGGTNGDFDNSGFVDGADFLKFQQDFPTHNLADFQADYGSSPAVAAIAAVPEPASALLVALALGLTAVRRRV